MSEKYEKDNLIVSGKTKDVHGVVDFSDLAIITNREDITANDDASLTKKLEGKGKFATNTTVNIFELLKKAKIPIAYKERLSSESFLVEKTEMIPLEVIIRRYAVGSYIKRMPHLITNTGTPHRFKTLVFELFLKTSDGECIRNNDILVEDIPVEDPLILNPYDNVWNLYQPKQPSYEKSASLGISIEAEKVLKGVSLKKIEALTRKTFLVIEAALKILGYRYIDFKIEFGLTSSGELVVSDVIDNDSGRLRTNDWKELSKENFRQGKSLDEVSKAYEIVSELSNSLPIIPEQSLILWRGSDSDAWPDIPDLEGVIIQKITLSAHKQPEKVLKKLNDLESKYPQGGVILAFAGMSNGLGPILSTQTDWPVINCPPGISDTPNDIWSSINLPSNVPASTISRPKNAVLHALSILSRSNPIVQMCRRYEIEKIIMK